MYTRSGPTRDQLRSDRSKILIQWVENHDTDNIKTSSAIAFVDFFVKIKTAEIVNFQLRDDIRSTIYAAQRFYRRSLPACTKAIITPIGLQSK